jgi:hypothetical protein
MKIPERAGHHARNWAKRHGIFFIVFALNEFSSCRKLGSDRSFLPDRGIVET